jgi:hypothetical protein
VSPNPAPSFEPVYNAPMAEPELPPLPGEITMDELMDLARRLSEHPENRPGTDKTWVLERMRSFQQVVRAPRTFIRVGDEQPPPSQPAPPEADEPK